MSKFCTECGKENEETAKFCLKCGKQFITSDNKEGSELQNNPIINNTKLFGGRIDPFIALIHFKLLFIAKGRLNRYNYIICVVFLTIFSQLFVGLASYLWFNREPCFYIYFIEILILAFLLIEIFMQLVVTIARLHDLNMNGWWTLLLLLGFINPRLAAFAMLIIAFIPSTKGPNKYGQEIT